MIERSFVEQKKREFQIQEFIGEQVRNVGMSHAKLVRTPMGEKIVIHTSRPGLVVGKGGENISRLTSQLKKRFSLENPQLEISEVERPNLDARIVAERIASSLERFGSKRFKGVLHKALEDVLGAGALGVEIVLAGKVPSARAKRWRVFGGYLKKSGDISVSNVRIAQITAKLKSGIIGIKVSIMPDTGVREISFVEDAQPAEPVKEEVHEAVKAEPLAAEEAGAEAVSSGEQSHPPVEKPARARARRPAAPRQKKDSDAKEPSGARKRERKKKEVSSDEAEGKGG